MLTTRVIPCLDVRDGRVVKGVNFSNLRDSGDPASLAAFYETEGADELVMLDVSATAESRRAAIATVAAIRAVLSIPLTVGGGVRSLDDAARLLAAGADKVAVNTAAVDDPTLIDRLADRFGSQCTVVAIDALSIFTGPSPTFRVRTRSASQDAALDACLWAAETARRGAGEILLTSINRDGTQVGYDLTLIRTIRAAASIPIIASGGAGSPADLAKAALAGADAVLAASIFHDGRYSIAAVKQAMASSGIPVRTIEIPTSPC
jgi:imidazoleglycerol phosphate synthase cyclase subunit